MLTRLELLPEDLVARILDEAFQLLLSPGVKVQVSEARQLLAEAGAEVDDNLEVARIPEAVVYQALDTVPREFSLYNSRTGEPVVNYVEGAVQFNPGSCGVHILDSDTLEHRPSYAADLVRLVKVAEMLPQYDGQSTAVVCNDVAKEIGDLYRLYLVLLFSAKPIVTGAFAVPTASIMFEMLSIVAGGREALIERPIAVFDVAPTPPLIWSEFAAQSLIDLARAGIPAELVSMPLAGAAAPVTLLGSVVQHAAECLSGIAIHQLAQPGAPIVWGGAPAVMDMRHGTTPMGAIETAMINASDTQVGQSLGLPTHAYLGASDSKLVDAQAGLESGTTAMIGALAGINLISGGGMLDFLACQSVEKLVVDAEAIGMVKRLLEGMQARTETLATAMFEGINFKADFLKQKTTRKLFRMEQYLPSAVIDRSSVRTWQRSGRVDTFARAKARAAELLAAYERPALVPERERRLRELVTRVAREAGMEKLPGFEVEAWGSH